MNNVLFTITQENLETGMRGYPVGYCTTSSVDPVKGLFYVGQPVSAMGQKSPEEVIYLLYQGKEATPAELERFKADLRKRSPLSPQTIQAIRLLPRQGHPMKLFCSALLICGMFEGVGDYREDGLNMVAKIPELAAVVINHHAGWGGTRPSRPELGYMENFTQMVNIPGANVAALTIVFRLFNILHYDHGGGNLSAFVGKAVASGLADLHESLIAAMAGLAGPRHGKANQDCLHFVQEVLEELGDQASEADVEGLIRRRLDQGGLIFGFGHAVLRVEDPRATMLYAFAQQHYAQNPVIKMAALLRLVGTKVLKENPKISNPYPNIDAISGALLAAAGFPFPQYFTVLFGLARVVGISRQIVYERCEAREGKGTPIVRPKYLYKQRDV